jgi:hypothetical protein
MHSVWMENFPQVYDRIIAPKRFILDSKLYLLERVLCWQEYRPESRNNSLLGNGSKQVPAEMYTHATIEELPFLCNGEVDTPL